MEVNCLKLKTIKVIHMCRSLLTISIFLVGDVFIKGGRTQESARTGGRVMVVGGEDDDDETLNTTEVLNISTMSFTLGPEMQSKRVGCAILPLDSQRFLVVGGNDGNGALATTEVFDLDEMQFQPGPNMQSKRSALAATQIDPERVFVGGGHGAENRLKTAGILAVAEIEETTRRRR